MPELIWIVLIALVGLLGLKGLGTWFVDRIDPTRETWNQQNKGRPK